MYFQHFISTIHQLTSISLQELETVTLLNRIDKKYVLNYNEIDAISVCLLKHYTVLEIDGNKIFNYHNNYFDTPEFQFYKDHHNGYAHRIKVRSRKYVESNLSYFEIKRKEKVYRTDKYRESIKDSISEINSNQLAIVKNYTRKEIKSLKLVLNNNFKRITLVNRTFTERVTIDLDLEYKNRGESVLLNKMAIIEIKQDKMSQASQLVTFLKQNNFRELSFSKYIYGILLFDKQIKRNNFLELTKKINLDK